MTELERSVYVGGPSHGEIVGGRFTLDESETVYGPKPIWWDWSQRFDHFYRPTGNVACGMLVYEYVGQEPPEWVIKARVGK